MQYPPRGDFFDLCNVVDVRFWPMYRQELSREASGRTQGADLGAPLWRATFTTAPQPFVDAAAIEAAILSLGGLQRGFLAHDMRFPYPRFAPDGSFADTAEIAGLPLSAREIDLSGLPSGALLRAGDYFSFEYGARPSRALHRITADAQADITGAAQGVTFEPPLRPGALVGASVQFNRAPCEMIMEPGQSPPDVSNLLHSSMTFSAVQFL